MLNQKKITWLVGLAVLSGCNDSDSEKLGRKDQETQTRSEAVAPPPSDDSESPGDVEGEAPVDQDAPSSGAGPILSPAPVPTPAPIVFDLDAEFASQLSQVVQSLRDGKMNGKLDESIEMLSHYRVKDGKHRASVEELIRQTVLGLQGAEMSKNPRLGHLLRQVFWNLVEQEMQDGKRLDRSLALARTLKEAGPVLADHAWLVLKTEGKGAASDAALSGLAEVPARLTRLQTDCQAEGRHPELQKRLQSLVSQTAKTLLSASQFEGKTWEGKLLGASAREERAIRKLNVLRTVEDSQILTDRNYLRPFLTASNSVPVLPESKEPVLDFSEGTPEKAWGDAMTVQMSGGAVIGRHGGRDTGGAAVLKAYRRKHATQSDSQENVAWRWDASYPGGTDGFAMMSGTMYTEDQDQFGQSASVHPGTVRRYVVQGQSQAHGGYRKQGKDENQTTRLNYTIQGRAFIPECRDPQRCSPLVWVKLEDLLLNNRHTPNQAGWGNVILSGNPSVAFNGGLQRALNPGEAILVDLTQGGVSLDIALNLRDEHIGACCPTDVITQRAVVSVSAPQEAYSVWSRESMLPVSLRDKRQRAAEFDELLMGTEAFQQLDAEARAKVLSIPMTQARLAVEAASARGANSMQDRKHVVSAWVALKWLLEEPLLPQDETLLSQVKTASAFLRREAKRMLTEDLAQGQVDLKDFQASSLRVESQKIASEVRRTGDDLRDLHGQVMSGLQKSASLLGQSFQDRLESLPGGGYWESDLEMRDVRRLNRVAEAGEVLSILTEMEMLLTQRVETLRAELQVL
jgi:hypothetical protein